MRLRITIAAFCTTLITSGVFAQRPFVYKLENTGTGCPVTLLPSINQLPSVKLLPDPFLKDNGKRYTRFADWECRRNDIKRKIEHYETGIKPNRPDSISASFADTLLTVTITHNGETMTLTAKVTLPSGQGPFPAVIGMNRPTGSIPPSVFSSRNIATITYSHN